MEPVNECDELVESAIEFEDIDFSDTEGTDNIEYDPVPLTIDGNSRILSKASSSAYSSDMQMCERENNHCAFQSSGTDLSGNTSSDELDCSDDGASFSDSFKSKEINLDSVCSGINRHFESASSFDHSSTVFKSGNLTDSEYVSDDDVNIFDRRSMSAMDKRAINLKAGLSVAGVFASVRDFFSGKPESLASLNVTNSFANTIFLKNIQPVDGQQPPLMTCVEFLNAGHSDDEDTDEEILSMDLGDAKGIRGHFCSSADSNQSNGGGGILDDAFRHRGKGDFMTQLQNNTRRSSWTTELLSDDEYTPADYKADTGRSKTKKRNSLANVLKDPDECLTDEEVVDLYDKEWSETDESGGVRQITQIKTETSIKLEGDGSALDGDGLVSTTTSTTTRVVTSVVSDPDVESEFQSTFVQQLSDDDIRQSCEITVNEVLSDNARPKPEEHDE